MHYKKIEKSNFFQKVFPSLKESHLFMIVVYKNFPTDLRLVRQLLSRGAEMKIQLYTMPKYLQLVD